MAGKSIRLPPAAGYEDPNTPAAVGRRIIADALSPATKQGNLNKVIEKVYDLSLLEKPPLRLIIGEDSLSVVRSHLKNMSQELEEHAMWSEGVKEV